MLEQILDYIHNYFVKEVHQGTYTIESGELTGVDFLLNGQYFKVSGSVLNDGVYQYPATNLRDEAFTGEIWAMAVPPAVVALSDEIADWVDAYEDIMNRPYASESFGGYSYSKAQSATSPSSGATLTWQSLFATRLNAWRKIS